MYKGERLKKSVYKRSAGLCVGQSILKKKEVGRSVDSRFRAEDFWRAKKGGSFLI